jgi:hypothetical protein
MNWSPDFLSSATISISYHLALKHYQMFYHNNKSWLLSSC